MKKETYYKELKDKGFTLVEIVVIIAIMVVLLAILSPSLLRYTENSRMQKDDSAMDELCGTFQLALADSTIFDEAFSYSITNNYVTYTDSSGNYGTTIVDEEFWAPDGSGHAVTITWNPDESGNYIIAEGIVNDMTYGNGSVADSRVSNNVQQCYLSEMGTGKLYHQVEQTFGSTFSEKSATYKNSSYTVFIRFNLVDGIYRPTIYGSFNGTNLSPDCPASLGSGTSSYTETEEPEQTKTGGTTQSNFTSSDLQGSGGGGTSSNPTYKQDVLPCGHKPSTPGNHEKLPCEHYACEEGNHEQLECSHYICGGDCGCVPASCGIAGHYSGDGLDHTAIQAHQDYIAQEKHTFKCQCVEWVVPDGGTYVTASGVTYNAGDSIPCSILRTNDIYYCGDYKYRAQNYAGQWAVTINPDVVDRYQEYYGEIVDYYINRAPITSMYNTFGYCSNLKASPAIPSTVQNLNITFQGCAALEIPPDLRNNINTTTVHCVFNGCKSIKETIHMACTTMDENLGGIYGAEVEYHHVPGCDIVSHCIHKGGTADCYNKAICTICGTPYGEYVHNLSNSGVCTICGTVCFLVETSHNYTNNLNYIVLGSWNYSDAKSVNITIEYETESTSYDWVSIVEGNDYIAGSSYNQTKNYLNTSGNIVSTTGTNSSVKFGGKTRTTKTFTNVNMLQGTVVFRSDSSSVYWGAKVTITPNY